jgi:hypothetical protein
MYGRYDLEDYQRSGKTVENWLVLPHGPIQRRPGFKFVYELPVSGDNTRLARFSFNTEQQYLLCFTNNALRIFRDNVLVSTETTTYPFSDLTDLRFTTAGDTMLIFHEDHPVKVLRRNGADDDWSFESVTFTNTPFYRYNYTVTITPSAATGTGITFTASDDYFSSDWVGLKIRISQGLATVTGYTSPTVITVDIDEDLIDTVANSAFEEEAFSVVRGYPRSGVFYQNRLVLGGVKSAPSLLMFSVVGDFYNFIDKQWDGVEVAPGETENRIVTDDSGFIYQITTGEQQIITELKASRNLHVFSTEAESIVTGGTGQAITPTNRNVLTQSFFGSAKVPVLDVEGELMFATRNNREIRKMAYDLNTDSFKSDNSTLLAHHIFTSNNKPVDMALLSGYRDTQSNFVFIPRTDGQLAVCTINTNKEVLGWSRFTTQGDFKRVMVLSSDNGNGLRETLYVVVDRENGTFIERLEEEDVYLDSHYVLTSGTAKTAWTGATALADETCHVLAGGLVETPVTVASDGSFVTEQEVTDVHIGLPYTSFAETMEFVVSIESIVKKGERITKVKARVHCLDTKALNVDQYRVPFRQLGDNLLDQPLPTFTGVKTIALSGSGSSPTLTVSVSEPLPCTILNIVTDILVPDA